MPPAGLRENWFVKWFPKIGFAESGLAKLGSLNLDQLIFVRLKFIANQSEWQFNAPTDKASLNN
jgi:hypothetical protein